MSEDIRIEMVFSEERDGWLYWAVRGLLSEVKQRNRSIKLKQVLAVGIAGAPAGPVAHTAGNSKPSDGVAPPMVAPRNTLAVEKAPEAKAKPVVRPSDEPVPTVGYGDGLIGFSVEHNGV